MFIGVGGVGPADTVTLIQLFSGGFDEFGAGGHPYLETPNIDRLAAEGATLTNAFHVVPLCSPNRASILTGQYPSRHGIIDNVARDRASHRLQTFPRAMQDAGYEMQDAGCKIRDAGCKMQDAGCRMQDAGCRMQDARYEIRDAGYKMEFQCGDACKLTE